MTAAGDAQSGAPWASRWRLPFALLATGLLATLPLVFGSGRREQLLALNSFYLAAATCLLAVPLGTLLAVLLVRTDVPGRRLALFLFVAMLFMPLYLLTAAWDAGFGLHGWYSTVFGSLGRPPLAGWRGAIWVHAMAAVPWAALIVAAGLRRADPDVEEAALLEAAPLAVFGRVTLPAAIDSIGLAALWVALTTAAEFTVADMYQVNTYIRDVYFGFSQGAYGSGVAAGGALTAWLAVAMALILGRLAAWSAAAPLRPPRPFRLGAGRIPALVVLGATVALIVGVPLANFLYQAGVEVRQLGGERLRGWSLGKLAALVAQSPGRYYRETLWTLAVGVSAATLAVVLAAPLAWLARRGGRRALPALGAAILGVAIPGPVIALALISAWNRTGAPWLVWVYDRTLLAPILVVLIRTLPWTLAICWFAFRSVADETLESAALDGAGPATRLLRIAAPQRLAALGAAWLVGLAIATGDLAGSILVMPPGVDTLAVRIFGLIHFGVDDQVAALCLTIVLAVVALAAVVWRLARRLGQTAT